MANAVIRSVVGKRSVLKSQLTIFEKFFEENDNIERAGLEYRLQRLTVLYDKYEDAQNDLVAMDPENPAHEEEYMSIYERYFKISDRVSLLLCGPRAQDFRHDDALSQISIGPSVASYANNVNSTRNASGNQNAIDDTSFNSILHATLESCNNRDLPNVSLPTFNGKVEDWISFKDAFLAMIGDKPNLPKVRKLQYLMSAVKDGGAYGKVKLFSIQDENYEKAWNLLVKCYEDRRIIVKRHVSILLNYPVIERANAEGLQRLADEMQQHISCLESFNQNLNPALICELVESKLPRYTADRWTDKQTVNIIPDPEDLFAFIYGEAAKLSSKRKHEKSEPNHNNKGPQFQHKKSKFSNMGHSFLTNASKKCVACQTETHYLYSCGKFKELAIPDRIQLCKKHGLCLNCLRKHGDRECRHGNCTLCKRRHNTLLHLTNEKGEHNSA